jgi:hypothetical protein
MFILGKWHLYSMRHHHHHHHHDCIKLQVWELSDQTLIKLSTFHLISSAEQPGVLPLIYIVFVNRTSAGKANSLLFSIFHRLNSEVEVVGIFLAQSLHENKIGSTHPLIIKGTYFKICFSICMACIMWNYNFIESAKFQVKWFQIILK